MRIKITSLDVQNEMIDVSCSLPTYCPDPDWVHVDADGNEHRWHFDEKGRAALPTLTPCEKTVDERCECCGSVIGTEREIWFEDPCGAKVEPGYRQEQPNGCTWRNFIPARRDVSGRFEIVFSSHHGVASCRRRLLKRGFRLEDCDVTGDNVLVGQAMVSRIEATDRLRLTGDFEVVGEIYYRPKGA